MKRKLYSIFTFICTLALGAMLLCGCNSGPVKASVVKTTDTMVVVKVEKVEGEATLMSVMETLKEEGELDFKVVNGMITEINGVANPADFSSCWMLYTSDAELSNSAWGTVEYDGQAMGSAIVGADTLTVAAGAYYVWSFQSF